GGQGGRAAGARRRDQRSDHLFLGEVVEHAAPGRVGEPHQVAEHGDDHAYRDAHHDFRILVLRHRRGDAARALHNARARARKRVGGASEGGRMNWGSLDNFLAMGGYGLYVWGSYGVTLVLIAAELILLARRKRSAMDRIQ